MTDAKRIEKQKEEIQRLREKVNSLQDENKALKSALEDKEGRIAQLESEMDKRSDRWEQHITDVSEAIEDAAEARLGYEMAKEETDKLRQELQMMLRSLRKTVDRKAV